VYVTAETYGTRRFWAASFGWDAFWRKMKILTDEPPEHVDTKVLEMLVEAALRTTTPAARVAGCLLRICMWRRYGGEVVEWEREVQP